MAKPPAKITVRVSSKDGNYRFELFPTDNLATLKNMITAKTAVPPGAQKISRDRTGANSAEFDVDRRSLAQLNVKHGDMLFLTYEGQIAAPPDPAAGKDPADKKLRDIKMQWRLDEYLSMVEKNTIKLKRQEKAVCAGVAVDRPAAGCFQNFLRATAFSCHRFGFLLGIVDENKNVEVQVIYEPPQEGNFRGFVRLEDPHAVTVDGLNALLGLKIVGCIYSRLPHSEGNLFSGEEVLRMAELQHTHGDTFVTIVTEQNADGVVNFEVYQLSGQCVEMFGEGLFALCPQSPNSLKVDKKKKTVIQEGKETENVDISYFICTVPITEKAGPFSTRFPIENRPQTRQAAEDLKKHLTAYANQPIWERLSDYHLLLFLTCQYFDLHTDMPQLIQAIRDKRSIGEYEGLLRAYAGFS
eukprot:gnl/Hemi2/5825_TR2016_c0_g1_i1.p1 gnl/Hemi2/5825_TR2016_c0_g1~~gnl/Hemi2/5825_TR2016_c0_g1_i1.p1  ORF type:complete len:412 (-),score=118.80 gnl/Hemi2/5825_TR2016_c0_g1_i1:114-1349(-)